MTKQRVFKTCCFCAAMSFGFLSQSNAETIGTTKSLKFIEGTIKTSSGANHSRVSSDFAGGLVTGIATQALNMALDNFDAAPSFVPSAQATPTSPSLVIVPPQGQTIIMTTSPSGEVTQIPSGQGSAATPSLVTISSQNQVAIVTTNANNGTVQITGGQAQPSISSQMIQNNRNEIKNQYALPVPFADAPIGIGIGLDTFFVPPGSENSRFESDLNMTWSFTKEDLDGYNAHLMLKELGGGLLPIGAIKLETKKSRFVREVGARADLGVDLKWKSKWHNNIVGVNLTDIAMEINEEDVDKLGASEVQHSDTVNVSDIPGLIIGLVEKISTKLGSKAGGTAAKEAGDSLAEKIFDEMEIGVLVTQTTRDRFVTLIMGVTVKDMNGQVMNNVQLNQDTFTFDSEGMDHFLQLRIPDQCPPIKSIHLFVKEATYSYKEAGNFELGVKAKYIPVELKTGKTTEGIAKYFSNDHRASVRDEDRPSFTVTAGTLALVPFHGIVQSNTEPAFGIEAAKVELRAKNNSFHKTEYTHPDGKFYGDFYVSNETGIAPEAVITVSKEGQPANRFITKFIDHAQGYKITMHLPSDQIILVSGKVTDKTGNPLEGAEVHAATSGKDVWVATDETGFFIFSVLKQGEVRFSAYKGGYNIPDVSKTFADNETKSTVNLQATTQMSAGVIHLVFQGPGKDSLSGMQVKRANGTTFNVGVGSDKSVKIPCEASETLTLSAFGFTFNPDNVTAQFASNKTGQEKKFDIVVSFPWSNTINIAPSAATIETGGVMYSDNRLEERAQLTATVKDISGKPMLGVPVRFDVVSKTQTAGVKFSKEGGRPGCGYGVTDAQGKVMIDIVAYNTLGSLTIKAVALDKYLQTGKAQDELSSSETVTITIVPTTRVTAPVKPVAGVQVYTNSKAVLGVLTPTVEKGGEFIFHLSHSLGAGGASPLNATGQITGYKIAFSKDNGSWQEEAFETAPPATIPKTFNEKGNYKIGYKVRKSLGGEDLWSDRAEAIFSVVDFQPPVITLTVPNTTATVNLPLSYSFNVSASAPFQSIALTFGDNDLDIVLDPNLLAGRTSWSGSYHHIYRNPGTYTMRLVAFDQNLKTAETTKNITVQPLSALNDTTPPTGSVVISNGAATTGEKGVMLRIAGQDNAGGAGIYRLRVSNDGTNWGAWTSINFADDIPQINVIKDYAWQLSDGSGNKIVYVQLKDASENVSVALTDSIELVAQSLQVAGNLSAPAVIDTFYTNPPMPRGSIAISGRTGNTVSANFTATNDWAIGINQMAISFNGQQWTPWMQYETNKQISLEGNLSATKLYVVFADRAGGQSPVYSADIPAASPAQVVAVETQDQAPAASQASTQAVTQAAADQQGQAQEGRAGQNFREEKERDLLVRQGDGRAILAQAQPREERVNEEKVFPDIEIENIKVAQELSLGARAEITVSVKNNTKIETPLFEVRFETEDGFKASQKIFLAPGRKERVVFEWEPKQEGQPNITVTAEYREDPNPANNSLSERVKVLGAAKPDVAVNSIRLPREISLEKMSDIEVVLKNESQADVRECLVMMESEDGFQDKTNVSLGPRAQEKILFSWTPRREGRQRLTITAEVEGDVNSSNNKLTENVEVVSERKGEAFGLIKERDEEMLKREAEER